MKDFLERVVGVMLGMLLAAAILDACGVEYCKGICGTCEQTEDER